MNNSSYTMLYTLYWWHRRLALHIIIPCPQQLFLYRVQFIHVVEHHWVHVQVHHSVILRQSVRPQLQQVFSTTAAAGLHLCNIGVSTQSDRRGWIRNTYRVYRKISHHSPCRHMLYFWFHSDLQANPSPTLSNHIALYYTHVPSHTVYIIHILWC